MAVTKSKANQDKKGSSIGTPAQHAQPSRKGKKAWRKHIDIGEVESGLEEARAEERELGSSVKSKTNDELFSVDVNGDENVRKHLPKLDRSQLTYNKTLEQRSAVPAVASRPSSSKVTLKDKKRLLRIGKRDRKGPFNSIEDPTKLGQGSALLEPSHAVKESGKYDVWMGNSEQSVGEEDSGFLQPLVQKQSIKAPKVDSLREEIALPAVTRPHPGVSYNPPLEAHQTLLQQAHDFALQKEKEAVRYSSLKEKMDAARKVQAIEIVPGVPSGMVVDVIADDDETASEPGDVALPKKTPARKTKQQRRKAEKHRAEKRALAELAARKRQLALLSAVKSTARTIDSRLSEKEQARLEKKLLLRAKLRESGLAGRRMGKHIVPKNVPEVQLGEDLSESLRGLKVEGNLFRDRFLNMQHRALLEPRAPVLPSRKRKQVKMVEKFAWKRFE